MHFAGHFRVSRQQLDDTKTFTLPLTNQIIFLLKRVKYRQNKTDYMLMKKYVLLKDIQY